MSTDFTNMGRERSENRYFYTFIHNVYGSFFRDMMDYFLYLYPRFDWWVMGTYDKAVEYLVKGEELGSSSQIIGGQVPREADMPMKGAIIMNPLGEFAPADTNAGGKQLWRYPNLAFSFVNRLFDPIYRDEHVKITPGFQRMKGEVELIMMVESFYEYCDLRMYLYSIFGGIERVIEPQYFTSFIIIDDELLNYEYYNEYTGLRYILNWESAGAYEYLVKTTNRNEIVVPVKIKPQLTLTGISDSSERYGGTDKLPSWKLNATVSYEVELPAFLFMEIDYLAENFNIQTGYGSLFSAFNDYQPPVNREIKNFSWTWDLEPTISQTPEQLSQPLQIVTSDSSEYSDLTDVVITTTAVVSGTTENTLTYIGDFVFKTRYFHTVTAADLDPAPVVVNTPTVVHTQTLIDTTAWLDASTVIDTTAWVDTTSIVDSTSIVDTTTGIVSITIPEKIVPPLILIVNSKDGQLDYKDHYDITDGGETLDIPLETVPLEVGQVLELYVYEAQGMDVVPIQSVPIIGGNDSSTVLLIHSDTYDGDTNFVDSSIGGVDSPHTLTVVGNLSHTIEKHKFGKTSWKPSGGWIEIQTPTTDLEFRTDDFTIDTWFYIPTGVIQNWLFNQENPNDYNERWSLSFSSSQLSYFSYVKGGRRESCAFYFPHFDNYPTGNPFLLPRKWYHLAFVRYNGGFSLYLNGVPCSVAPSGTVRTFDSPLDMNLSNYVTYVGARGFDQQPGSFGQYMDEFRISKVARWTGPFIPEKGPYD